MRRAQLLGQLSLLLGVPVFDVARRRPDRPEVYGSGDRLPNPRKLEWRLKVRLPGRDCDCGGSACVPRQAWVRAGDAGRIRNPRLLTAFANRYGRASSAPPFTAVSTRSVLRLLHQINEMEKS